MNRESSAVAFLDSMEKEIERLMRTGDIATLKRDKLKGKPREHEVEQVEADTLRAHKLCTEGMAAVEVARGLGITENSLRRRFQTRGLTLNRQCDHAKKQKFNETCVTMRQMGQYSSINIARILGISQSTVSLALSKAGITQSKKKKQKRDKELAKAAQLQRKEAYDAKVKKALDLIKAGAQQTTAAKQSGMNLRTLRGIISRAKQSTKASKYEQRTNKKYRA